MDDSMSVSQGTDESGLFPVPAAPPPAETVPAGPPRLRRADRKQMVMRTASLEGLLPEGHRARVVWEYVEGIDMTGLYGKIRSVGGHAGRDATDPRILLALWLYATLEGVGSARELARLCQEHVAYQWICGGVTTNYHTLSDFRVGHPEFLDELLTQSVATLMHEGLVALERVAQDGMRVRAHAGSGSFRRRKTLERCQAEAKEQVEALGRELEEDPAAGSRRRDAARERAARERSGRIQRALAELVKIEAKKKGAEEKEKARASMTDPEARVMKMGDGGFRPAHNVQMATDTQTQVIAGVDVVNAGSDRGQMPPMVEQLERRYEKRPSEMLVDGGFVRHEDIEAVSTGDNALRVYAPVAKNSKAPQRAPHEPVAQDSEAIAQWRARMGTPEAKELYKDRASTAECVNAAARNRGLQQFLVRGLGKVLSVALWFAIAHNLVRAAALRAEACLTGG